MNTLSVFKLIYLLLEYLGGGIFNEDILFESLESKTSQGEAVFNQVSLVSKEHIDVWKMKQSHHGIGSKEWDHIEIRVHKKKSPYEVSYHQIKNNQEIEYKADCLRCHSGGPRLIRVNTSSQDIQMSLIDKMTVFKWNNLIKSYGRVEFRKNTNIDRMKPLKLGTSMVQIKSCTKCHSDQGGRSPLYVENIETIKFLFKNKMMPPWPHSMSKEDEREIKELIYGF